MRYVSTRGGVEPMAFSDAVMAGLAADGGLLMPESVPEIGSRLHDWRGRSFVEVAQAVFRLYVDDIAHDDLDDLIAEAFATFEHPDVIPLVEVGDVRVLELFHGPTLAFKDVALQALGRLFEHILARRGGDLNIVGATSGDTGSAAIAAVAGRANMTIFVMFPDGRTSPLQELQMTAVQDANVHCLAVDGSFDDCQRMLKTAFGDREFKARHGLRPSRHTNISSHTTMGDVSHGASVRQRPGFTCRKPRYLPCTTTSRPLHAPSGRVVGWPPRSQTLRFDFAACV